ncbi:MAG: Ubiquitin- modifier 1 [Candelina submexicana]|nr:MAG: Ubiquitin- modifier 1 [Candelina submexicana]
MANIDKDCSTAQPQETVSITVEFTGGLEMLFSNQRKHALSIPARDNHGNASNVAFVITYLCEHLMKDTRRELLILDGTVRPGILVLINDVDWELEGEDQYELQQGDNLLFVSTLHGG